MPNYPDQPYVLDTKEIGNANESIAALTAKNRDFLEAVVALDSNYRKDSQLIPPDEGFDIEVNAAQSDGKYCGSLAFWFDQMQRANSTYTFSQCVLGAVISIDRSNSTHLEQVSDGRKRMRDRIVNCCPDLDSLKDALATPFTSNNQTHLISKMTEAGLPAIKEPHNDVFFISFASKFCAYSAAALGILNDDGDVEYSKYDNVVSDHIKLYINAYLNEFPRATFKISSSDDFDRKRQKGLEIYQRYREAIGRIIERLRSEGVQMTRSELDHIIWYCEKGR